MHKHRARTVPALAQHVAYQPSTLLNYLLQLVLARPYGETTRLVERLLPSALMEQLYRVPASVLCGRLAPLMAMLDEALDDSWRKHPHRWAMLRVARQCRRKKKVGRHLAPSERGVVTAVA